MITWLSAIDFVHHSFLNSSEMITEEKYHHQQIDEVHQKLECPPSSLINRNEPIIRTATCCTTDTATVERPASRSFATSSQSPNLSPSDYQFFSGISTTFCEKCFKNQAEIEVAFNDFISFETQSFM